MPSGTSAEVLVPLLVLAVVAHVASLIESGQLLFGVTVTARYAGSDAARMLRKKYVRRVWSHTVLAAAVPALLGEWNLVVGLGAVAWQGAQAGLAWWGSHMEALANEEEETASLEFNKTPEFSVLANIRLVRLGPYLCVLATALWVWYVFNSGYYSLVTETISLRQFAPYMFGFLICAFIEISVYYGKKSRILLGLCCQYLVAISIVIWCMIDLLSTGIHVAFSVFQVVRLVFLMMVNHLIFLGMKHGLVGLDPEWESRPGFDSPPVESLSITGSEDSNRNRSHK